MVGDIVFHSNLVPTLNRSFLSLKSYNVYIINVIVCVKRETVSDMRNKCFPVAHVQTDDPLT